MTIAKAFALATALSFCAILGCSPADSTLPDGNNTLTSKVLPAALSLNIDEFPEDDTSETARGMMDIPSTGHGRFCVMGPTIIHRFDKLIDAGLTLAAGLNEDLADVQDTTLASTMLVRGVEVAYKADFAAFDIDGDGTADGSGTPDTAPVALRLWVDPRGTGEYEPFLCALLTTLPGDTDAGAGKMYVSPHVLNPSAKADFRAFISWDRTDQANLWNEAYFQGTLRTGYRMSASHSRVDLKTLEDGSVEKTLRNTGTLVDNPVGIGEMRFASRTIEGLGFGLLNAEAVGSGVEAQFNICTSLENCSMHPGDCSTIDPDGMDYLQAPAGNETDWPADFPAAPTF